jgi:predicted cupin superfamily sugar epimerase
MIKNRIDELTNALGLTEMNLESGLFQVLGVSGIELDQQAVNNVIYFMLTREMPQSYLHRLESDDVQILIEGGPVDYYLFSDNGTCKKVTMGHDVASGQQPIVIAPGGTTKALILHKEASHLLIGSVVSPSWSPTTTRYGAGSEFLDAYENKATWASREFLKYLVGPNFDACEGYVDVAQTFSIDTAGQIIYQGMQLTEEQFIIEAKRLLKLGQRASITSENENEKLADLRQQLAELYLSH